MDKIVIRLKKIRGQLNSIIEMIEQGDDCQKILTQFLAAKEALNSALSENLNQNLEQCLRKHDDRNMKNIIKLISKK